MAARAFFLHLRWFALFAFVAISGVVFKQVQGRDSGTLGDLQFWLALWPTIATCLALAIIVPWGVFAIDPRRGEPLTLANMLRYWKAL